MMGVVRIPVFTVWFVGQIVLSSWSVSKNILTAGLSRPTRVVQVPLASSRDWQVALFGALITLTPGTLTLGVVREDSGERFLLVHSMEHHDNPTCVADLQDMEARMLVAFPGRGGQR